MAGRPDEVRVYLRGAGKNGRALRYYRKQLVGLTVDEAIKRLDDVHSRYGKKGGALPNGWTTLPPYYLNGKGVGEHSDIVSKEVMC